MEGFVDHFHKVSQMINSSMNIMLVNTSCLGSTVSMSPHGFLSFPQDLCSSHGSHIHFTKGWLSNGDKGKPIMWCLKIVEGKDQPKKLNGTWAFPSEFEGHNAMTKKMLEMCKPLFGTNKVVIGNSGFCMWEGVVELHQHGVFLQVCVKKRAQWPWGVPANHINGHFAKA